jgi:hypothetical protein
MSCEESGIRMMQTDTHMDMRSAGKGNALAAVTSAATDEFTSKPIMNKSARAKSEPYDPSSADAFCFFHARAASKILSDAMLPLSSGNK